MKKILMLIAILCLSSSLSAVHQVIDKHPEEEDLYPLSSPYVEGYLKVSDLHTIYYAQFGNPEGIPVIALHGGPGSQCYENWTRFFDPAIYRVIMFDQRGAGRSFPSAEMKENTPHHSVNDIELLRRFFGIEKWILFGGSYGSTLAILYGETYPEQVLAFILRGVTTSTREEYEHLFYGMKAVYPEYWEQMAAIFSKDEQRDLVSAFEKRIMDPNPEVHLPAARAFMYFDTRCATLVPNEKALEKILTGETETLNVARAFIHYSYNHFFLDEKQLLQNVHKIKHLPAILVQGRNDIICQPQSAYSLYVGWDNAELWFIPSAGHSANEKPIAQALKAAMDTIHSRIQ